MPPVVLTILVDANKGIVELQSFDKAVQSTTKSTQQSGQSAQQASQGTQAFGASLGASVEKCARVCRGADRHPARALVPLAT